MSIFENLEEKNLFLIQQGQENEEQIEEKKRNFAKMTMQAEQKLGMLENREKEMQNKKEKTSSEYKNLKSEISNETSKTITPATYEKIHDTTVAILQFFDKKELKNAPTLALLLEIETRIEQADAYILSHMATESS